MEPADARDALDSRELSLAFLQRAIGLIPFPGNFFEMLPQSLRRHGFGQNVV